MDTVMWCQDLDVGGLVLLPVDQVLCTILKIMLSEWLMAMGCFSPFRLLLPQTITTDG